MAKTFVSTSLFMYNSIIFINQVFDTSNFVDSLYTWSAFNTEGVGKIVGGAVAELSKVVDVEGIHLIGNKIRSLKCRLITFLGTN